jgi:hypothetical protein
MRPSNRSFDEAVLGHVTVLVKPFLGLPQITAGGIASDVKGGREGGMILMNVRSSPQEDRRSCGRQL